MRLGLVVAVCGLVAACGDSSGGEASTGDGSSTGASATEGTTADASSGAPTGSGTSSEGSVSEASASGETSGSTTAEPTTTAVAMTEPMTTDTTDATSTGSTSPDPETGSTGDDSTGPVPPACGDGKLDDGEACDDGPGNADDAKCTAACVVAVCGDGLVLAGEEACDDGNADNTDACTELCAPPSCEDGILSGDESDLDCGGTSCQGCTLGQMCAVSDDCAEGDCFGGVCTVPESCKQLAELEPDADSQVYEVDPDGDGSPDLQVFCEMMKGGGGWTLVAYNYDVPGTFLKSNYHPVNVDTSPVTPTPGKERAFDPADVGIAYAELGFFTDDMQWSDPSRDYRGFWIGDNAMSTYDLNSPLCQMLRPSDIELQWKGDLVYHGGDGANDNGCIGGGSMFTNNFRPSCDDGAGCVTVNAVWPTNGSDPLWGWNYLAWHGGAPANNLFKKVAGQQKGLYAYYVR